MLRAMVRIAPDGPALALGRAHEVSGPARFVLAALAAGALAAGALDRDAPCGQGSGGGVTLWVRGAREPGGPDPQGLAAFMHPGRLLLARAPHGTDALWTAEEALRSGAVALVVLEPREPPGLTPVRRLQLAAEAGAARGPARPLCLILTAQGGCAAAVETRWRVDPLPGWAQGDAPGGGPARWRFALTRDKAGPPATWEMTAAQSRGAAPRFERAAA